MQATREDLDARLPAVASPGVLYDFDVLVTGDGRFLTVWMAWHGPAGVEVLKCLPGVHPLVLLGNSIATDLPTIEIPAQAAPVLLLGRFRSVDDRLALKRPGSLPPDEEAEIVSLFPGYGRFDHVELVAEDRLRPGDVIVAEDGRPHEVTSDGLLSLLDAATWRPVPASSPVSLCSYLEQRDMSDLPAAKLI
ncbi:MAG TPA: hypothetical protein VI248_27645 [Kineosporiaceae bacterium]